jgi:TP901 family phage tail tape measure protein
VAKQFSLSIVFKAVDQLTQPIKKMSGKFRSFRRILLSTGTAAKILGRRLKEIGRRVGSVGRSFTTRLTLPIVAFGALSLRTATRFRSAMNFVQGVTKTTGKEFDKLENLALKLGRTTQFTAVQAAEAMLNLAKSGFTVNEMMGALPKVLQLAASAQIDLESASRIVTGVMGGMRIEVDGLGMANDVLVNAFTKSRAQIDGLGEAFKRAGASVRSAGLSFKDITAAFQALAKVELKGGVAGRGLNRFIALLGKLRAAKGPKRSILNKLGIDPKQFFTAEGKLIDIVKIVRLFERASLDLFDAVELFGQRGGPIILGLATVGADKLEDFRSKLDETGIAARLTNIQMQGLPGTFKKFISVFETLEILFVKTRFGKVVKQIIERVTDWMRALADSNPRLKEFIIIVLAVAAAIGPFLVAMSLVMIALGLLAGHPVLLTFTLIAAGIAIASSAILIFKEELVKLFDFIIKSKAFKVLESIFNFLVETGKGVGDFVFDIQKQLFGLPKVNFATPTLSPPVSGVPITSTVENRSSLDIKISTDEGLIARPERVDNRLGAPLNISTDINRGLTLP